MSIISGLLRAKTHLINPRTKENDCFYQGSKFVSCNVHVKASFFFFDNKRPACPSSTSFSSSLQHLKAIKLLSKVLLPSTGNERVWQQLAAQITIKTILN